jgi:hypothetical protein
MYTTWFNLQKIGMSATQSIYKFHLVHVTEVFHGDAVFLKGIKLIIKYCIYIIK